MDLTTSARRGCSRYEICPAFHETSSQNVASQGGWMRIQERCLDGVLFKIFGEEGRLVGMSVDVGGRVLVDRCVSVVEVAAYALGGDLEGLNWRNDRGAVKCLADALTGLRVGIKGADQEFKVMGEFMVTGVSERTAKEVRIEELEVSTGSIVKKATLQEFFSEKLSISTDTFLPTLTVISTSMPPPLTSFSALTHLPLSACVLLPFQSLKAPENPERALEEGDRMGFEVAIMAALPEVIVGEGRRKHMEEIEGVVDTLVEGDVVSGDPGWIQNGYMKSFGIKITRKLVEIDATSVVIRPKETLRSFPFTHRTANAHDEGTPRRAAEVIRGGTGAGSSRGGNEVTRTRRPLRWGIVNLDPNVKREDLELFCREVSRLAVKAGLNLSVAPFPTMISPFWVTKLQAGTRSNPVAELSNLFGSLQMKTGPSAGKPFTPEWIRYWILNLVMECRKGDKDPSLSSSGDVGNFPSLVFAVLKDSDMASHDVVKQLARETHLFLLPLLKKKEWREEEVPLAESEEVKFPTQCIKANNVMKVVDGLKGGHLGKAVLMLNRMVEQLKVKVDRWIEEVDRMEGGDRSAVKTAVAIGKEWEGVEEKEDVALVGVVAKKVMEAKGNEGEKKGVMELRVSASMDAAFHTYNSVMKHCPLRLQSSMSSGFRLLETPRQLPGLRDCIHELLTEHKRRRSRFPDRIIYFRWWDEEEKEEEEEEREILRSLETVGERLKEGDVLETDPVVVKKREGWQALISKELGQLRHGFEMLDLGYRPRVTIVLVSVCRSVMLWNQKKDDLNRDRQHVIGQESLIVEKTLTDPTRAEFILLPPKPHNSHHGSDVITSLDPMATFRRGGYLPEHVPPRPTPGTGHLAVSANLPANSNDCLPLHVLIPHDENGVLGSDGGREFVSCLFGLLGPSDLGVGVAGAGDGDGEGGGVCKDKSGGGRLVSAAASAAVPKPISEAFKYNQGQGQGRGRG
ncbi:hypothetical protein HDU97_004124 [Phlyctochytrium planicorne]|nr:hypothetical protein HDU97_004124 [Phlyctochytrium planicorne]